MGDIEAPGLDEITGTADEAPEPLFIDFKGERFRIADRVGLMPLMKFAHVSRMETATDEALSAMYDLLRQCIHDDEWLRFEEHANRVRADEEDILDVVRDVITQLSDRPTRRSSEASGGPSTTGTSSMDDLSSRVIHRYEAQGRPDLALLVDNAVKARAAS